MDKGKYTVKSTIYKANSKHKSQSSKITYIHIK